MSERVYRTLVTKGMDLRCKCSFNCNCFITVHDSVVSKPSTHGRKYYLLDHYNRMAIDLNGNNNNHNGLEMLDDLEEEF